MLWIFDGVTAQETPLLFGLTKSSLVFCVNIGPTGSNPGNGLLQHFGWLHQSRSAIHHEAQLSQSFAQPKLPSVTADGSKITLCRLVLLLFNCCFGCVCCLVFLLTSCVLSFYHAQAGFIFSWLGLPAWPSFWLLVTSNEHLSAATFFISGFFVSCCCLIKSRPTTSGIPLCS